MTVGEFIQFLRQNGVKDSDEIRYIDFGGFILGPRFERNESGIAVWD